MGILQLSGIGTKQSTSHLWPFLWPSWPSQLEFSTTMLFGTHIEGSKLDRGAHSKICGHKHRKTGRIHGRRTTKAETHYCRYNSSKININNINNINNNNNNNNNRIWKEASLLQKKVVVFAVMHHSLLLHMTEVKSSIVALSVSCPKCMCA